MNNTSNKRYYSPQFSALAAVSVRRVAWALNVSMPAAVDHIVRLLPRLGGSEKVCLSCKDKTKCGLCIFCAPPRTQEVTDLMAGVEI